MYIPNISSLQIREVRDHGELHDDSLDAGQLVGIVICMLIILVGIVCFLFVLGRHCYRSNGINLWPSWCCTCYPADALEKAQQSYELSSHREATKATEQHAAREVDAVQPPKKALMSLSTMSNNESEYESAHNEVSSAK